MLRQLALQVCRGNCFKCNIPYVACCSLVDVIYTTQHHRTLKIYTKTGDKGRTSLFTGERRSKFDSVFEALGDVDELNSNLGLVREYLTESEKKDALKDVSKMLVKIQCSLLDIGSCIATPLNSASDKQLQRTEFDENLVQELEQNIDRYWKELPELKNFILPSGGKLSCSLHVSRSVCRRAERKISSLLHAGEVSKDVAKYVNRLSDLLFTLARYAAFVEENEEVIYKKQK